MKPTEGGARMAHCGRKTAVLVLKMAVLATIALIAGAMAAPTATVASGPVPVFSCQMIRSPGSYVLTGNFAAKSPANKNGCLIVSAPNVTINLAGFVMSGDGKEPGIVFLASGGALTVLNGTLKQFSVAVQASAASVRLDGLRIYDWTGTGVILGPSSLLTNNSLFLTRHLPFPTGPDLQVGTGSTVMLNFIDLAALQVQCPSNVLFNNIGQGEGKIVTSDSTCNIFENAFGP